MTEPDFINKAPGELVSGKLGALLSNKLCLYLPEGLPFEDWSELGKGLAQFEHGIQWWVGDWWAFGGQAYGERAKASAEGIFGRAFQTLKNAGSISRRFERSRRRDLLPWSHHAEVAALPDDVADKLLDEAEAGEWSKRELRGAVSRLKTSDKYVAPDASATCQLSDLNAAVLSGAKFGTIYADPPWLYDNQGTRASTGNHYGGMTVEELCALPIRDLAADDAHLHLWTTNGFIFDCPRIFEAWGFEFRSSFVWVKSSIGIGNYWRNSHEFLLTAIRGDAKRFKDKSLRSWLECDRGAHSAKPEQVRSFIERASPGPFLELFGRREAQGWAVWGNQIERSIFDQALREVA